MSGPLFQQTMWTSLRVHSGKQRGGVPLPAGLPGLPAQLQPRVCPEQRLPQPQGLCQVREYKRRKWIMSWIYFHLGKKYQINWKYYIFSGKCITTTTTTRSTTTTCRTQCDKRKICDTRRICDKKRHCDKRRVCDKKCFLIFVCKQNCKWIHDRNCRYIEYNCRNEEYNCRHEDHNCRPICGIE